jgi:trigger factor
MYSYKLNRLPKNTSEITIDIPLSDINKEKETAFSHLQDELTVEGFRKGKAPKEIAEKHISKEALYQELIKSLLPKIYEEIVKKDNLKPIANPKVELLKAKENEDWQIKITLAEKPIVDLGRYKEAIKEAKAKIKKTDIWVPGKGTPAGGEKKFSEEDRSKLLNGVLTALLKEVKIEISDLIVEEEVNHRLTRLVDDVQKIGLTVENYLKSKNLTMEVLKAQFKKEAEDTYKIEFILSEIAEKENIKVEKEDIDKILTNIKDEKERKMAEQNSYYYATILRKQKTLDFLISL